MTILKFLIFSFAFLICVTGSTAIDFFSLLSSERGDYCITNSTSGIYFENEIGVMSEETRIIPRVEYFCDFERNGNYKSKIDDFEDNNWKVVNSLPYENYPILDSRWEVFPMEKLEYMKDKTIRKLPDGDFKITISVLSNEAQFLFCDSEKAPSATCLWFMLQHSSENQTILRKCQGQVPSDYSKKPDLPCLFPVVKKKVPTYMSLDKWGHIIFRRTGSTFFVERIIKNVVTEEILRYTYTDFPVIKTKFMIGHTEQRSRKPAYYKIHKHDYLRSTTATTTSFKNLKNLKSVNGEFCLSLMYTSCKGCSARIILWQGSKKLYAEQLRNTFGIWNYNKIVLNNRNDDIEIFLEIETIKPEKIKDNNNFWAIDNVQQCHLEEYRVTTRQDRKKLKRCNFLENEGKNLNQDGNKYDIKDFCESPRTLGMGCISCDLLEEVGIISSCQKIKICENRNGFSACFCSLGYTGPNCETTCQGGKYGPNCQLECGNCKHNSCNEKSGRCHHCDGPFEGPKCNEPKYDLILEDPPILLSNGATWCKIRVNFEKYLGKGHPKFYLMQFQDISSGSEPLKKYWQPFGSPNSLNRKDDLIFTGLKPKSQYSLRVLISSEQSNIWNLQSYKTPYNICKTTCKGWNDENIILTPSKTQVEVQIKLTDECTLNTYRWMLKSNGIERRRGEPSNSFSIPNLLQFTDYELLFIGPKNVSRNFKTLEGVPMKVRHLKSYNATANTICLKWAEPEYFNGNFQRYKIEYQRIRGILCRRFSQMKSETTSTTNTSIVLSDLAPYSIYNVRVYVVNNKYKSEEETLNNLETSGLDLLVENEEIENVIVNAEEFEMAIKITNLKITNIDCDKLKGPLFIWIKYYCVNEWCETTHEEIKTEYQEEKKYPLTNLKPFTKYNLSIAFCRTNCVFKYNNIIETKASFPTEISELLVTSKGENYIKLRWLPPFPPTGTLDKYEIVTTCNNCDEHFRTVTGHKPKECQIWPNFHCVKLTKDISYNKNHTIEIRASNKENDQIVNVASSFSIMVKESASEEPYNLTARFDENNTLKISWNHPNVTNGDLKNFRINVFYRNEKITKTFPVKEKDYRLTYSKTFSEAFPPAEIFRIEVTPENNFEGYAASINESSYPTIPELLNSAIKILNYTKTTITISLNSTKKDETTVLSASYMFVLIKESNEINEDENVKKLTRILNITLDEMAYFRLVNEIDLDLLKSKEINFTIGEKSGIILSKFLGKPMKIEPLNQGRDYNITVIFVNEFEQKFRHSSYSTSFSTDPDMTRPGPTSGKNYGEDSSSGRFILIFLLLVVLISITIGVFIIIYRKKIIRLNRTISIEKILEAATISELEARHDYDEISLDFHDSLIDFHPKPKPIVEVKPTQSTLRKAVPNKKLEVFSKPVSVENFKDYVKTAIEIGELKKEHALFPKGQTQPWLCGSMQVNKAKNRYNNLFAYDHSRVKLEILDEDPYSDYINANYINGYNLARAYIATQGPKATTIKDFWRMIWQENVRHIVMLANIVEGGKERVARYWPNINEEINFEDIWIETQSVQMFTNFECRIFNVTRNHETRRIEQIHFIAWPDHGVPFYSYSLVPLMRYLSNTQLSSTSPVVVHCSAGVGRTGTILLCDISLRMAAKEGTVDMLNILQKLREQRSNMVDNVEQYKLAHLVVLECLMGLNTSIPCNDNMDWTIEKLIGDREYITQMEYLRETEWQDQAMKSVAECLEEFVNYPEKDRFEEIVPENQGRLSLTRYPNDDPASSYINAVQVDGFRNPSRFIVTQQPMPNTVGDFWRMVVERHIKVIISLNEINLKDKTCCEFWPTEDESELQPVDFILVKFGKIVKLENYDIYSLQVWVKTNEKEQMNVELVAFKKWNSTNELPTSLEDFLAFWEEADNITRRSNNIIVTCFDGATACGVYVALSFIIEKMKLEQECDVCLGVRTIRHNRNQFINGEKQFQFLYEAAVKSYEKFRNQ